MMGEDVRVGNIVFLCFVGINVVVFESLELGILKWEDLKL